MNLAELVIVVAAVGVAIDASGNAAHAEGLIGTFKKIRDTGIVTLSVYDSSIPFSYSVSGVHTIGRLYDAATKIAEDVKRQLGLEDLKVNETPVTSQNCTTLLRNDTVDLECGSTTSNLERQKQASSMNTIFIIGTHTMVKKDSGVKDWADLKGRNVVITAGITSECLLRKMNDEKQMGINIISTKDYGQSFLTLESGYAVAFMMDDALLYGERVKVKNLVEWVVVAKPQSRETYGCMVRKGDKPFKALANKTIAGMTKDGTINAEYKKWLEQPVPPKGANVEFPLPDDMKTPIKNPDDKALDRSASSMGLTQASPKRKAKAG